MLLETHRHVHTDTDQRTYSECEQRSAEIEIFSVRFPSSSGLNRDMSVDDATRRNSGDKEEEEENAGNVKLN